MIVDGGPHAERTLGFWDGPGPDEVVEFFAYQDLFGQCEGVTLPWHVYLGERMWMILEILGYRSRG
jgi:hypothetical protein